MLRLFILLSLFTSVSLASAAGIQVRPKSLHCKSPGAWGPAADFMIEQLDTNTPSFPTLDAADDARIETSGDFTKLSGNNGCDTDYNMVFATNDLKLAAAGKIQQLQGLMNYVNGDMDRSVSEAVTGLLSCSIGR